MQIGLGNIKKCVSIFILLWRRWFEITRTWRVYNLLKKTATDRTRRQTVKQLFIITVNSKDDNKEPCIKILTTCFSMCVSSQLCNFRTYWMLFSVQAMQFIDLGSIQLN